MPVDKTARVRRLDHKPAILWFTGLSGAGKSTIANLVESALHEQGAQTYLLDGDIIRRGLCRDLAFTDGDRVENIRRAGEVARLFVDAGVIVVCAFISPFRAERLMVRALVEPGEFIEIFVDTPLDECMRRDPKGLYARARDGRVPHMTGITSPYEPPEQPEIVLDTAAMPPSEAAEHVVANLAARGIVRPARQLIST